MRDEQRLLGAELTQREAEHATLRIERSIVMSAIAPAASGTIDEKRAEVMRDAREERRHEVGGVSVVALEDDDRSPLAAVDDVEVHLFDVHDVTSEVD
jgi:hypothetical protein